MTKQNHDEGDTGLIVIGVVWDTHTHTTQRDYLYTIHTHISPPLSSGGLWKRCVSGSGLEKIEKYM
jgi:hypothetical protein